MIRILRTLINIVVGIIELLLTFRLIFKFLTVNTDNSVRCLALWGHGTAGGALR